MRKLLPYIVGTILIIGLGAIFWVISDNQSQNNNQSTTSTNNSSEAKFEDNPEKVEDDSSDDKDNKQTNSQNNQTYSIAEVAAHNNEKDCWTIINDSVYNITSYIPRHPGGDEILRACGTDGTSLFESRTTSDGQQVGSGTGHSSNAESQLASLKIGTVNQ